MAGAGTTRPRIAMLFILRLPHVITYTTLCLGTSNILSIQRKQQLIAKVCQEAHYKPIIICTPEELVEVNHDVERPDH